jgi:hypothetical protein
MLVAEFIGKPDKSTNGEQNEHDYFRRIAPGLLLPIGWHGRIVTLEPQSLRVNLMLRCLKTITAVTVHIVE